MEPGTPPPEPSRLVRFLISLAVFGPIMVGAIVIGDAEENLVWVVPAAIVVTIVIVVIDRRRGGARSQGE